MSWRQLFWPSNLLSISRVALVWPLSYWLAQPTSSGTIVSLVILVIAGLTDFLDGYLARKQNQITPLGTALDPIADKIFAAGFMILLILHRDFPLWLAGVLIGRDLLLLLGGVILLNRRALTIPARLYGKYLFFATVILLASYVIRYPFGEWLSGGFVLALCVGSLIDYAVVFKRVSRGDQLPPYDPQPRFQRLRVGVTAALLILYGAVWFWQQRG